MHDPRLADRATMGRAPTGERLPAIGYWLLAAACAALTLLFRWPFLHMPLTNDEGGYAYVARLWASGVALYHGAWVDRPQGLVLLFRLLVSVAPSTADMRLFGALYAALSALLLSYVGARLYGRAAGLCAAALFAVFSTGPQIEGFIVNGELLATLPTVGAVALLLRAHRSTRPGTWLVLAGCAAGTSLLIKQSALDGVVAVLVFAAAGARKPARLRLRRLALALLGVAAPPALSAAHGAVLGWQEYLDAVVLDNLRYRSLDAPGSIVQALPQIADILGEGAFLVVAALLAGAYLFRRQRSWPQPEERALSWLPVPWLAAAVCGVTLGGLYSRHYFVQLLPPLCLLAALGLVTAVRSARRAPVADGPHGTGVSRRPRALAGLLLVAPLAALVLSVRTDAPYYLGSSPIGIAQRLYGWTIYTHQADLVALLRRHVPAGEPFFTAYAAAPLHYLTGRPSITRYLWRRPLGTVPGAYEAVLRKVQRAEPVCIVATQAVSQPPGDARMGAAVARHYAVIWKRSGVVVYCRPVRARHAGAVQAVH